MLFSIMPPFSSFSADTHQAKAVRSALMGSLHQAHRPELADVVAAAELALDFPGLWLRPRASGLDAAWLEGKLFAAAVADGLPLAWIHVLSGPWEAGQPE
jgi:hypothetical protein